MDAEIIGFATEKLANLEARDLRRSLKPTSRRGAAATRDDDTLISFSDNDYLGLGTEPEVIAAGIDAAKKFGAGAGASRLVTGDVPLNQRVEDRLAAIKGTEAALLFGSGYLANIGAIPVLAGPEDVIILDELSHSCIHAGAALSRARVIRFRHNDVDHAAQVLRDAAPFRRALIITETVFSMDGDRAPLQDLAALCANHHAWLMTDDAHGLGVIDANNPAPVQMGTLSKAAGAYGGYVCGPQALIDLLVNRARSFVYTTGLPPFVLGAADKALEIIASDKARREKVLANARLFCRLAGLDEPQSAIVPLILGEADAALAFSARLQAEGFLVTAIRPPTVPEGTARLRFAFSALHREADIRRLAENVNSFRAAA
ncbi:MAG: aminotransferase class I/II-fold pyridoxal phosphate-dependent enzyme [Pseudomonadota bacterium]